MKKSKKILLIISGGIAAYKTLELIRSLVSQKFEIKTILTKTAEEFVTPLSIASLSKNKVYQNKFDLNEEMEMDHIALSRWADLILVVPATAHILENIANGAANDFAAYTANATTSFSGNAIDIYVEYNLNGAGNTYLIADEDKSGNVSAGDTLIILSGLSSADAVDSSDII